MIAFLTVVTLSQALATAQKNSPAILQARANVRAAEARVIQNRAPLLPQLTTSDSFKGTTNSTTCQPGIPSGMCNTINRDAVNGFWNFGLTLSQRLYDFQSIETFRASNALARSQAETEKATLLSIESTVRTSYFNARAQKALIQVAKETLDNQLRHLTQIEGFVRVGSRPEIDLAQARTDKANAQVLLINAENGYGSALAQLNLAMGVDARPDFDVAEETLAAVSGEDEPTEVLLDEALKARPEVASLIEQVRAQQLALSGAKGAYGPTLSLSSTFSANGTDITDMAYNWNATVQLGWTIFDGLRNWGVVKEASANRSALEAQVMAEKQQVRLEVEQNRLAVRTAKASLEASGEALTAARERLRLAEGRYQAGVGNIIELGDAQLALTNAAAQKIQAEYTLASARALLLRALGRR